MSSRGEPYTTAGGFPCPTTTSLTMLVAVEMALECGDRPPSVAALQARFGMSRATAYRWRGAFVLALQKRSTRVQP